MPEQLKWNDRPVVVGMRVEVELGNTRGVTVSIEGQLKWVRPGVRGTILDLVAEEDTWGTPGLRYTEIFPLVLFDGFEKAYRVPQSMFHAGRIRVLEDLEHLAELGVAAVTPGVNDK